MRGRETAERERAEQWRESDRVELRSQGRGIGDQTEVKGQREDKRPMVEDRERGRESWGENRGEKRMERGTRETGGERQRRDKG